MIIPSLPYSPDQIEALLKSAELDLGRRRDILACEESFSEFVRRAWPYIDPTPYQENWALDALCEHLQALADGDIRFLLVNFPPRCGKTLITSVCFPAWVWAQREITYLTGPQVRFLCGSYNHVLSLQNSNHTRRLVQSPWYKERWGDRFDISSDQNAKNQFDNTKGGSRVATSVKGTLLGSGGDIILIDDPHNTEQAESEAERETATNWWKEIRGTRMNDPMNSAIGVIMQRLHEEDVSGLILAEENQEFVHLMIPMEYDPARHCHTVLGVEQNGNPIEWEDPRTEEGELMWPSRFGHKEVEAQKRNLGMYMASGRLQQSPTPAGGGIFKREWWNLYPPEGEEFHPPGHSKAGTPIRPLEFPNMAYVIGYVDTALTEKTENDPSAMTVWGVFKDPNGLPAIMLMDAWEEWLEFRDLVDKTMRTAEVNHIDRLIIEAKANGHSVAQEIGYLLRGKEYGVNLADLYGLGDKVARAHAISHLFEPRRLEMIPGQKMTEYPGMIWAPDRKWADLVIERARVFPKGSHDDIVDTISGSLKHLRDLGLAKIFEEYQDEIHAKYGKSNLPKKNLLPYEV